MNQLELVSKSAEQTENIARLIGARLMGGEVIELISDLGGGKTTFTRGLVEGAGSKDIVSSPTFTVSKVYKAGTFEIHHFDFYRLGEAGLAAHELQDLLKDNGVVIVVEWGGVVEHVLPDRRVTINLVRTADDSRKLNITFDDSLDYLVGDL